MQIDPHNLSQIIQRIYQQMRCPQCGKRVPIDFASVRIVGDDFLILQLKCETCDAFIVLHASIQGNAPAASGQQSDPSMNASSSLTLSEDEMQMLRSALDQSNGSFEKIFKAYGEGTGTSSIQSSPDTRIA